MIRPAALVGLAALLAACAPTFSWTPGEGQDPADLPLEVRVYQQAGQAVYFGIPIHAYITSPDANPTVRFRLCQIEAAGYAALQSAQQAMALGADDRQQALAALAGASATAARAVADEGPAWEGIDVDAERVLTLTAIAADAALRMGLWRQSVQQDLELFQIEERLPGAADLERIVATVDRYHEEADRACGRASAPS